MLLAITGGLLDAVVYLNHGHVFANAMSGNVIFSASPSSAATGRYRPSPRPPRGLLLRRPHLQNTCAPAGIHSVLLGLAIGDRSYLRPRLAPHRLPAYGVTTIIAYVIPYTGAISQPGESILTTLVGERIRSLHRQRQSWLFYVHAPSGPTGLMLWFVNRQVHVTYQ